MSNKIMTIARNKTILGILATDIAYIYENKILITCAYIEKKYGSNDVKFGKISIRYDNVISDIRAELNDECILSAWKIIDNYVENAYSFNLKN